MHNLKVNFDKILNICKLNSTELVNEQGNVPRAGPIPRFSDLEVISLSGKLNTEAQGEDKAPEEVVVELSAKEKSVADSLGLTAEEYAAANK